MSAIVEIRLVYACKCIYSLCDHHPYIYSEMYLRYAREALVVHLDMLIARRKDQVFCLCLNCLFKVYRRISFVANIPKDFPLVFVRFFKCFANIDYMFDEMHEKDDKVNNNNPAMIFMHIEGWLNNIIDVNYWGISIKSLEGTTQTLNRSLFPLRIIRDGIITKNKDSTLTDITGDERLLKLLPERFSDYFILSDFYKEISNFQIQNGDLVKTKGFLDSAYRYSEVEISKYFSIDIIHSSAEAPHYHCDFLPVFKYAKARGLGENFGRVFHSYLKENDIDIFITEKKYGGGKKDKIIYVVRKYNKFKFLGSQVVPSQRPYGVYQYIPEAFYNILVNSNTELENSYRTWYWISKNTLKQGSYCDSINKTTLGGPPVLRRKTENLTDERGIRLFYTKNGLGYQPLENSLAPIEEIKFFTKNASNPTNKTYVSERIQDFEKNFPDEQKIYGYEIQKKN